jgi:hypothetical protein
VDEGLQRFFLFVPVVVLIGDGMEMGGLEEVGVGEIP